MYAHLSIYVNLSLNGQCINIDDVFCSGLPTKDDVGFIPGNSDPYGMFCPSFSQ